VLSLSNYLSLSTNNTICKHCVQHWVGTWTLKIPLNCGLMVDWTCESQCLESASPDDARVLRGSMVAEESKAVEFEVNCAV